MIDDFTPVILFVDDDPVVRAANVQALELEDIAVEAFADARSALARIDRDLHGAVVSDIRMAGMDGLELFAAIRAIDAEIPVILISGHADVPTAVGALRDGAFDFLAKPFAADHLVALSARAIETRRLVLENRALRQAAEAAAQGDSPLIGDSAAIVALRNTIQQVAQADIDVLVEGETGTGKELVARLLHMQGRRRGKPFVALNCGALPQAHAEVELFGRTGAVGHGGEEIGQIERSSGGTLLLDEIDSMPADIQVKLLRVLEEREVLPLGAERPRMVDLRIVATAKRDLRAAVDDGTFRADLYYRLSMVRLRVPPLRERREDIPQLFAHFFAEAQQQVRGEAVAVTDTARRTLRDHNWPGNVRELRNFAFAAALDIGSHGNSADTKSLPSLAERLDRYERDLIAEALDHAKGDIGATMAMLDLPRKTLYYRMKKLGIDPKRFRSRKGSNAVGADR